MALSDIAEIRNGQTITKAKAVPGAIPVVAGGRGTISYHHDRANVDGRSITISKSGAYAGFVWWHETPIWASDCLVIRSMDEDRYLPFYLYLCLKSRQEEIYGRQQGTGQPHFYRNQIADFPVPDLPLVSQRAMIKAAHSAVRRELEASKQARRSTRRALTSIGDLYR